VIRARQFVNAGGAWAMNIAHLAGCSDVDLLYAKGTLLVNHDRMTRHVVNRLRPPGDGDILVPGGTVSLLGTTSTRIENPDKVAPTIEEIDRIIREGAAMIPALAGARYTRAFSRVRPLLQGVAIASDRAASRGFALMDHASQGLDNFCTITGGKLTTFRLMAEKAADLVAARLGNDQPGTTATVPLPSGDAGRWTEPGAAPRHWYKLNNPADMILCECEMVPQSAVDQIIEAASGEAAPAMSPPGRPKGEFRSAQHAGCPVSLEAISLRSRIGKGPCQGSFCGIRVASYLYDQGHYRDAAGLAYMRDFFDERFKGQRGVIWGAQAAQMELAEALHCGLLGLDALEAD
jgi:glycerol-3-phosphate dehydrogenase